MTDSLTLAQARALWWQKQALAGTSKRPLAALIGESGWLRTLGGVDAYIAARARRPGMKRAELDAAIAAGELRVHPAVRGCIYLVPAAAVPDLLALGAETWRSQTEKDLARIGKTLKVVEALAPGVLAALTEPMTTDAIRKACKGEIGSFGDAGKKVGLSSPLPLALRLLEFAGKIERTLDGGRLDTERYLWRKTA
ncbi:MAG TPA: crosslink repair DNA glycosylase YcaQ family protein, partial [Kofleriaceae bacterium]